MRTRGGHRAPDLGITDLVNSPDSTNARHNNKEEHKETGFRKVIRETQHLDIRFLYSLKVRLTSPVKQRTEVALQHENLLGLCGNRVHGFFLCF